VLGKTFTARALAALSGLPQEELELLLTSLVRKEVLGVQSDLRSPEHGQYGFLQDLVRHVAYETLSKRERKSRHLAAAQHLEQAFPEIDEVAEVLASHYLSAVEAAPDAEDAQEIRTRAREMLARAGERAASLAAPGEGQRYFEQAAALSQDAVAQAQLTDRAGQMAWLAGAPAEARALLESARAAYEERNEAAAAARVDRRLADIDFQEGHPPRAVARLQPALAALETAGSDADVAPLAAQLGRFLIFTGAEDKAAPHLERALTLAEALDLPETLAQALNSKSVLLHRQHRAREALILVEGALAIALEHDLHAAALRAFNNLGATLWILDRWREHFAVAVRGLELARRVGDRIWQSTFLAGSIGSLYMLGRWDEALERAAEAEELATTEFAQGLGLHIVRIHGHRGALEQARGLLTRHAAVGQSENAEFAAGYLSLEATLLALEGRPKEASATTWRALQIHGEAGVPPGWIQFEAFEAATAVVDGDQIRRLLGILDGLGAAELTPSLRAQQARFRARLPENDAENELATAQRLFGELEAPFHLAVVQVEHAEWLTAQNRSDEGEPLLAEASETFERLQATPWLDRVAAARLRKETQVPA
jgi:tetratricopeptide (TPR) repeat protein